MLKGDVRRLAHIARRLLTDSGQGELARVAAPRVGRIHVSAPNNQGDYDAQAEIPAIHWISGGAPIAGVTMRGFQLYEGQPNFEKIADIYRRAGGLGEKTIPLHKFMYQRVAFFRGTWCNRHDVIDYVANVGHGVHSGKADTAKRMALDALARSTQVGIQIIDQSTIIQAVPREKSCDGISYEMLCTLYFVSHADDVRALERTIGQELGI
jgi:hypothetical protein